MSKILIENNTFVTFSDIYDSQNHQIQPMSFVGHQYSFQDPSYPYKAQTTVRDNVYVGFLPERLTAGGISILTNTDLVLDHTDLNSDFSLKQKVSSSHAGVIGSLAYTHKARAVERQADTKGAVD